MSKTVKLKITEGDQSCEIELKEGQEHRIYAGNHKDIVIVVLDDEDHEDDGPKLSPSPKNVAPYG